MRISDWSSDVCSSDLTGKALLDIDRRITEQVLLRHTTVAQRELRSVGRTDAELVFKPHQFESRRTLLDHERFDRSTDGVPVDRRPHHHQSGAITSGKEELHPLPHVTTNNPNPR